MLSPSIQKFLLALAQNNNREWFDANKDQYTQAKDDFEKFVAQLMQQLIPLVPELEEQKAAKITFRIYKDIRFSKDKTPYKINFGAYFSKGGRKWPGAGYYLHIQPNGKSFLAAGSWMPEAQLLKNIRQEIDYNFDEFKTIIDSKDFEKIFGNIQGESLKKLPKGFEQDAPAAEFLKMKSFIAVLPLPDTDFSKKNIYERIINAFTIASPLVAFINRCIEH